MKTKRCALILAGMFLAAPALGAMAGGPAARGNGTGTAVQSRSQTRTQDRIGTQDRIRTQQRLRDGSCIDASRAAPSGAAEKRGNSYGPGDGSGPYRPKDGTGFGAPSNR